MAMGIESYYSYPPHKSALAGWDSKTGGGAGGGVAGPGGGTQGLAHWMSVMAEHMNPESSLAHHPYMWPNGIDQKMSLTEQQQLLQKGGGAGSDARQDSASGYYSPGGPGRPESAASSSPPASGAGSSSVLVPQPISGAKVFPGHGLGPPGHPGHPGGQPGIRKYQCKMCPQVFASKADLQLHTQIHMREPKPYKCASCNKAFANSSYLSQHTRIHLGIKPYRCEICQRKFTQLSHLQQHIRTHTGDKPYKCRIPGCTKAFSQLSNLQSHSRCHQTDKPHKCQSCYKCFADEAALLEHIPKHKESKHVKTHICPYCGKSYTQESYLAKHMQKHSDRMDKRAPVSQGAAIPGLGGPDYWSKLDMSALYHGYGGVAGPGEQPRLPDTPLTSHDARDYWSTPGITGDPRNTSAFSHVAAPSAAAVTHTTSALTEVSRSFDSLQFHKQHGQDLKSGAGLSIPLSQLRSFAPDKGQMSGNESK